MKDTVITAKAKKRELIVFLVCVAVAVAINMYAIIKFDRGWEELFTQASFTLSIAVFLYVVVGLVRIVIYGFRKLLRKK